MENKVFQMGAFLYQVIAHVKWDEGSILRYNKNMKQTAGAAPWQADKDGPE